jgi:2-hydroxycyclohexanecarboxyl-CoA dehydrogenase
LLRKIRERIEEQGGGRRRRRGRHRFSRVCALRRGRLESRGFRSRPECSGLRKGLRRGVTDRAHETARWQIIVSVVRPEPTDTALFRDFAGERDRREKLKAALTRAIPSGRLGRLEGFPGAILFLTSDDAAFITGQVLSVSSALRMAG